MIELVMMFFAGIASIALFDSASKGSDSESSASDEFEFEEGGSESQISPSPDLDLSAEDGRDADVDPSDQDCADCEVLQGASVTGEIDDDYLFGDLGPDTIHGMAGCDVIVGGIGDDKLIGGDGNDFVSGEDSRDLIEGNSGDDFLVGGDHFDTLYGGDGADTLLSGAREDVISADLLTGDFEVLPVTISESLAADRNYNFETSAIGGEDQIFGGTGNDLLILNTGGAATGGAGMDKFVLLVGDESIPTIRDFDSIEDNLVVHYPSNSEQRIDVRIDIGNDGAQYLIVNSELICRLYSDHRIDPSQIVFKAARAE